MKRSEINAIMRDVDAFLAQRMFYLPPWAHWPLDDWRRNKDSVREIVDRRLGWDITDFGRGNFEKFGLFLFTIRNGSPENLKAGRGKTYCEKALVVDPDQLTPMHYHKVKTEDIINRGGGDLIVQVYNCAPDGGLAESDVVVNTDGIARMVRPGSLITLTPGESITLEPHCYHAFWASKGRTLVGEVSLVNDDATDNFFNEPIGRFPTIDEDEAPLYLLVNDYDRIL
jgi:hypothetical protein